MVFSEQDWEVGQCDFLSIGAVARTLDVSTTTVRYLEQRGRLSALRDSTGRRLYRASDVLALRLKRLEAQQSKSHPE